TLKTIGKWSADGQAAPLITINDPVAGLSYSLDPRSQTAFKSSVGVSSNDSGDVKQAARDKAIAQKKEMLALQGKTLTTDSTDEIKQMKMKAAASIRSEMPVKESLGKQVIEGIEAEGMRVRMTIPAGDIGNTLPLEITTETWYSPELQLIVLSKQHD